MTLAQDFHLADQNTEVQARERRFAVAGEKWAGLIWTMFGPENASGRDTRGE